MATSAQTSSCKLAQVPERFVRNHVKTRMCSFFLKKKCLRGNFCKFAHNQRELRSPPDYSKTRFCEVFFETGLCPIGEACTFAHSREELRARDPSKAPQLPTGRQTPKELEDSNGDGEEPLVAKNLTVSTACVASTGRRNSWAEIMDDDDCSFDKFCESWSSSGTQGCFSLSDATDFEASPSSSSSSSVKVGRSNQPVIDCASKITAHEVEEKDEEEEVVVEYVVKRSFFHLQPASTNLRFARALRRSASLQ